MSFRTWTVLLCLCPFATTSTPIFLDDIKTPCQVPRSTDPSFETVCAIDYLQKAYICDPDHTLSRTEFDRIDRDVIRPNRFFYYCPSCYGRGQCKNATLIDFEDRGRRRRNGKVRGGKSGFGTENIVEPMVISINVYKKLVHPVDANSFNQYLPCANHLLSPSLHDYVYPHLKKPSPKPTNSIDQDPSKHQISEDQILDIYATLSEKRWTSSKCQPNLTILIFMDDVIKIDTESNPEEFHRKSIIFARYNRFGRSSANLEFMIKVRDMVTDINTENVSSSGISKLERFLSKFAQWYKSKEPSDGIREIKSTTRIKPHHTIPMWAAVTFGVCSVLSVLAVLVGNLVTSSKATRRHKNSNGNRSKRKWGAGFSGGMWASV